LRQFGVDFALLLSYIDILRISGAKPIERFSAGWRWDARMKSVVDIPIL
jgi:hypothetical protein